MTGVPDESPEETPADPRLSMGRRSRIGVVVVCVLALVGAGATYAVVAVRGDRCGSGQELVSNPRDPLLDAEQVRDRDDDRLHTLAEAVEEMGPPFGELVGGLGYNYDQLLHVYGIEAGVLAWTRHNAPVTLLGGQSLEPRWALRPATKRTAWDAYGDRFLLADLAGNRPTDVSLYDTDKGTRVWCHRLEEHHRDGSPFSTTFLGEDGDVVVAMRSGSGIRVSRLAAGTGAQTWTRTHSGLDRADYLGEIGDVLLAGGAEEYQLGDLDPNSDERPVLAGLDPGNGKEQWTYDAPAGGRVHVVGTTGERVVLVQRAGSETQLVALDADGEQQWEVATPGASFEATLRGEVVLLDAGSALFAYDAESGEQLWTKPIPTDRTFFPYGFTLDQMPSLDETHVLMPTTTDLRILDVEVGSEQVFAMPTDGVSTTYWPYQLMATPDLIGVVTNTGAVLVRRTEMTAPAEEPSDSPSETPSASPTGTPTDQPTDQPTEESE